jgi:hypothetical protein
METHPSPRERAIESVRRFHSTSRLGAIWSYEFHVRVLWGSPIPETEQRNEGSPQAPRSSDWGVV